VLCIVHSHEREHRHRGADFAMHNDGGVSPKMSRIRFKAFSTDVYPAAIPCTKELELLGQHQRQILKIFKRQVSLVRALGFATAACFVPVVNLGRS
jgi:hypothetical protein